MTRAKTHFKAAAALAILFGIIVGAPGLAAQERRNGLRTSRFSISAGGGMGRTESHQGLIDMKLGLQYGLTPSLRLGLGFGYLKSEGRDWMGGSDRRTGSGYWGGTLGDGQTDEGVDFRIKAVTLELAYALPVGRRWDVTIGGGAGAYFGDFAGQAEDVHRRSWGGQGGLGIEYRFSAKLNAFADAGYRFLEFRDVPAPGTGMPLLGSINGLGWDLRNIDSRYAGILDMITRGAEALLPQLAPRPMDVRLSGPTFRLGLRFGL
jgi:hypothetical protein